MRYAIVSETCPPDVNGVSLTVAAAVGALRARGHDVELIRPTRPHESAGTDAGELRVAGCGLPRYPGLRVGLPCFAALERHWRRRRPDALYVATEGPLGWSALRVARRLAVPVATGLHTRFDLYMRSYGLAGLERPALAWLRYFHSQADTTWVATDELASWLRALGVTRVEAVPRSADIHRFSPHARDAALRVRWGLAPDDIAVLYFGRLAAEKNLALAVATFDAIRAAWTGPGQPRMIWVGDGSERHALAAAHPSHIFCGTQNGPELPRHIASADLFLFPSRSETFGNVVLEAMACGVATVAFNYAAAREHLEHGRHGACVDTDADFVQGAIKLARQTVARREAGIAARRAMELLALRATEHGLEARLLKLATSGVSVGLEADAA